jgi:hypothetical protein
MAPLDAAPQADTTDSQAPKRAGKTIFRNVAKGMNYTQIPNDLLCDTRLDLDERGALSMILSFPTDWDFSEEQFRQKNGIGHNRVSRIIRSLEKYGYCKRVRERNDKQQWVGRRVYLFTNMPGGFPDVDERGPTDPEPTDPKPSNGEPHTQNPQMGSSPVASSPVGNGTRQSKERDKTHKETNPPSEGERAPQAASPPAPEVKPAPDDVHVIEAEAVDIVDEPKTTFTRLNTRQRTKKAGASHVQQEPDLLGETPTEEREIRFPPDWVCDESVIALGASCGLTEDRTRHAFDRCQDHFVSGKGKREKRTPRQWFKRMSLWFKEDANRQRGGGPSYTRMTASEQADANVRASFGGA